jgi:hypothetical protein
MTMTRMAVVTGDTYRHKDALRAAGGRWDGAERCWLLPEDRAGRFDGVDGLEVVRPWEWSLPEALDRLVRRVPGAYARAEELLGMHEVRQLLGRQFTLEMPDRTQYGPSARVVGHVHVRTTADGQWVVWHTGPTGGRLGEAEDIVIRHAQEAGLQLRTDVPFQG